MRNILKIEIYAKDKKAKIFDINKNIDVVEFNDIPSGYVLFKAFKCSDMLNIKQNINYYDDLNLEQKNILDNLIEIKLNFENNIKSYDFISTYGSKFNLVA